MKKIKTTDITTSAAMPVKQGTLDHLQSAYQEIGGALYLSSNRVNILPEIVFGCKLTQVSSNWSITAGAVYYALTNEIYLCDAASGTLGVGQDIIGTITTTNLTAANADPVEFSNGLTYHVHEINKMVWSSGTSGPSVTTYNSIKNLRKGYFQTLSYSAAYLTANVGNWTVPSSSDFIVSVSIIGVQAIVDIQINNYTNTNSAAVTLSLELIVSGLNIIRNTMAVGFVDDLGGAKIAQLEGVVGTRTINITILSGIDNPTFTNFNANGAGKLRGQITLEIDSLI
jgi:hypothetical protein